MRPYQVRDKVSQQTIWVYKEKWIIDDGPEWCCYYTDAPEDPNFPDGHRLASEIAPLDFVGPLQRPCSLWSLSPDGDYFVPEKEPRKH